MSFRTVTVDVDPSGVSSRSLENPSTPLSDPADWLFDTLGSKRSASGIRVNRKTALTYGPFWRGVNLISRDVAKLPLIVYKRNGEGKDRAPEHPAFRLLRHKPNPEMTSFTVRQVMQSHVLLHGNAYAYVYRLKDGTPIEIVPLDPEKTYPLRENGRLWYAYDPDPQNDAVPLRRLLPSNVLHIKGLGYDGLVGYSVVHMAKESLGMGMAINEYGSRFFSNNAQPSIVLEHPSNLSAKAQKRLKDSWTRTQAGLENAHKPKILEEGMSLKQLSINARDAQLIEALQQNIRDVANFLGVPPHKLGDTTRTAYASLEQENQSYLDDALDGYLVNWEEELRDKLLTEEQKDSDTHAIEFLRAALVRANLAARAAYYRAALGGAPWLTRNEVRSLENYNPMEGMDEILDPMNMGEGGGQNQPNDPADTNVPESSRDAISEAAQRRLVAETAKRLVRRLAPQAVKAAKREQNFIGWTDEGLQEQFFAVRDELAPVLEAVGAALDGQFDESEAARGLLAAFRSALLDVSGHCTAENLAETVERYLKKHETDISEAAVAAIFDQSEVHNV